ncbi:hypothetical protein ACFSWD_02120 [Paenibacillus xanthanilyticus]
MAIGDTVLVTDRSEERLDRWPIIFLARYYPVDFIAAIAERIAAIIFV